MKSQILGFFEDYLKLYKKLKEINDQILHEIDMSLGDIVYHCTPEKCRHEHEIYKKVMESYNSFLNVVKETIGIED